MKGMVVPPAVGSSEMAKALAPRSPLAPRLREMVMGDFSLVVSGLSASEWKVKTLSAWIKLIVDVPAFVQN
jgi:hypothetical protein